MDISKNLPRLTVAFFLTVGLVSCGKLPFAMNSINLNLGVDATNIRDIKLAQDKEATVNLQGKVIRQVPLVGWIVYQLQDSTGTIWVLTKKTKLQLEDRVVIEGKVRHQSIPLAGKDFGEIYIEEQQQLERVPAR